MPKVDDIKVLNIDDVAYAVDEMSDEVKKLVDVYNEWNQRAVDVQSELLMVQSAKNDLSRQIIMQVRKEKEEAEGDEEAANDVPKEVESDSAE